MKYLAIDADDMHSLLNKEKLYRGLAQYHRGHFGFVHTDKCDSLLLSALVGIREDFPVKIDSALDSNGFWHRRPLSMPECYPQHSKSSMSRDMAIGLLVYSAFKSEHLAANFLNNARDNSYVIGIGDPSRIIMMPALERTLGEYTFGRNVLCSRMYRPWSGKLRGYAAKLELLHILAVYKKEGGISKSMLKCIERYARNTPDNILAQLMYAAFTGDRTRLDAAVSLLLGSLYPPDRLPTNRDRSVEWFWDAQNINDKLPDLDSDIKEHPGADFLFYMHILKYILNVKE